MSSPQGSKRPVGKKYVVACDGTWNNSDMGYDKSISGAIVAQIASNIPRIVRALKHHDEAGIPQIVFYQRGVGTDNDLEDKYIGGLTGNDLAEHVREAYAVLANNFNPETQEDLDDQKQPRDEIVLFGFSRGAFTARAISSLISDIGLLTKIGMESFWGIFSDWMNQDMPGRESSWYQATYGKKVAFTDPEYKQTLIDNKLTRWGMPIRALGVWDTVGALGIPIPWSKTVKEFSFVNTKVAQQVEHAFQALALDEKRGLYSPTLWEQPDQPNKLKLLKQCWFPGVHSNIGGSYPDAGIANITLAWMVSQMEDTDRGILSFDPTYLDWVQDLNTNGYAKRNEIIRPWGMGKLYDIPNDSLLGMAESLSNITRTPGRYHRIDNADGKQTQQRLVNTNESIHRCVRVRIDEGGLTTEADPQTVVGRLFNMAKKDIGFQVGPYKSAALSNYQLVQPINVKTEVDHSKPGPSGVFWKAKDGLENLPEDELGRTEIRMMKRSIETARTLAGHL